MITVDGLVTGYGRLQVLKGVSLTVAPGEMITVLGANGAGKSTLLRTIQGFVPSWSGRVTFEGRDITGLSADRIVRLGLTLVPESRDLFPQMSVLDNLELGAYVHRNKPNFTRLYSESLEQVFALFPVMKERRHTRAAALSGGQQQMLAIARAMMTRPRAFMFDEPSLGLAPVMVQQIFSAIETLRLQGHAIILVEQNVRKALGLASRGYVLETGAVVRAGNSKDLLVDPRVISAYLGTIAKTPGVRKTRNLN